MGELDEEIMDGSLRIDSIDDAVRKHVVDAYDDNGDMLSSGEISSQVIKSLGFDGVVDMNVNQKFGQGRKYGTAMEGIDADTAHIITFPGREHTVRSRHAMFDPKKAKSKDILASAAGASIGLTGMNELRQRQDN
jgi:1,6-anhydro-N-acetylmuramate kinase